MTSEAASLRSVIFYGKVRTLSALFSWQLARGLLWYLSPENQNFFHRFFENCDFQVEKWKVKLLHSCGKQGLFKTLCNENAGFSTEKTPSVNTEWRTWKKSKISEKSVDKWDCAWYYKQALERAGRKRPANDDSAKALCKLNNTKKDKKPWQLFEFEKYFSNSIWEAKFELI